MARVLLLVLIGILAGLALGFGLSLFSIEPETEQVFVNRFVSDEDITTVTLNMPAVNSVGEGVIATLEVSAMPGSGRVLTNINDVIFWADVQDSIRTARELAAEIIDADIEDYDLVYNIETEADVVEGGSAGAAFGVATILALEGNEEINSTVAITGTITPGGRIGLVGGVEEKAIASRDVGATLFLVPKGSFGRSGFGMRSMRCDFIDGIELCETEYVGRPSDVPEGLGIEIVEVDNIEDALQYFRL